MSEDFVTRAELQAFQAKVEHQMQAFMAEIRRQSSDIAAEVRGGIERIGNEAREGRAEILDSNRSIGERISVLIQNVDRFSADVERTKNQYDRAAEALAARVGNLERWDARHDARSRDVLLNVKRAERKQKPRGGKKVPK